MRASLRPICESVRQKADALAVRYLGAFQFSALNLAASELADKAGFTIPRNLPFTPDNRTMRAALADVIQSAHALASDPENIRAHLNLRAAVAQFDHSVGLAADKIPARTLAADVQAPEPVPFAAKRAPRECVLELSNGSAQMAGRNPHSARELSMRDARIVAILAKRRFRNTGKVTRRQIAELISEAQAMPEAVAANFIYC